MKNIIAKQPGSNSLDKHKEAIEGIKNARPYATLQHKDYPSTDGLAELQRRTLSGMQETSPNWGFNNLPFEVTRQKLGKDTWKLTVENPKTREIILEAEGEGDKVFAYEDNLARMAQTLSEKGLKITTKFDR